MRVFVTGPTGSGKSTFAGRVADGAALPLYSLDDIHWVKQPGGDRRRAPDERLAMLLSLVQQGGWVIEGVQFKWADPALDSADKIVVLDIPRWSNTLRILRRFARRRRASKENPRATWTALREELRWSSDYYRYERALLFEKLARYREKVIEIHDERTLRRALAHTIVATAIGQPANLPA
ncbi:hypothetical protein HAP47_0002365 [Bradyrhizobium sp. 41S5]|uniref:hypothetical protein n=1 Tax=Bradyrhizobium sp. 41S5 TaxID=1404443 RepID=UPI00156AAE53|nr:hypothetical protein [Bradyrhizobium sp. 41S5]UFX45596.1 hypothetical protein HAP47_0002365 [Bradyrhizobium sp. 41S5]